MKNGRYLAILILICVVLSYLYAVYNYNDHQRTAKNRSPLLPTYQVDVVFNNIVEQSGDQRVVVNIKKDGKYDFPGENFTFDYQVRRRSFQVFNKVKNLTQTTAKRNQREHWDGYLRVHAFGEELSKQMRIFLGIANFHGFEKMRIVAPRFANGVARSRGPTPFEAVYNLDELNQVFAKNNYPPIVTDKEYDEACKHAKPIYIINFARKKLLKDGVEKDWTECDSAKQSYNNLHLDLTARKIICATYNFNIATLRKTVLKNVKCIEVPYWPDHGGLFRIGGPGRLSPDEIFHYALNPSSMIVNEANMFIKQHLKRPFVAIHMRANHINNLPSTINRCFKLAMRVVGALKKKRGVKSVYLSTDMSTYGGLGSFDPGHEEYFAAISGAVRYTPNVTGRMSDISRTSISITNVLIHRKSDHLIAVGAGSFHGFVMGQFLSEHFERDPKLWSLINMCENARGRGMTRDPNADYSKYIKT